MCVYIPDAVEIAHMPWNVRGPAWPCRASFGSLSGLTGARRRSHPNPIGAGAVFRIRWNSGR